jgi:hypothetical protein
MRAFAIVLTLLFGVATIAVAQAPPSSAKGGRVFEMRTYYANPGKLEALHARFREHTTKIFEKHGMTNVGYWIPIDQQTGAPTGNTLVYILAYPSLEARKQAWDEFGKDPEWIAVRDASEKDGKLVEKVDSIFLSPTDYSAIK